MQVNVFIRNAYAEHYLRDEKMTEIQFIGTVGGILGLFLGFSFVSIAEVVYLCMGIVVRKVGLLRGMITVSRFISSSTQLATIHSFRLAAKEDPQSNFQHTYRNMS